MKPEKLKKHLVVSLLEDIHYVPEHQFLDDIGHSLKELPMGDPLRKLWAGHRMEELRGDNARAEFQERANAEFLRELGIELDDDISLDF